MSRPRSTRMCHNVCSCKSLLGNVSPIQVNSLEEDIHRKLYIIPNIQYQLIEELGYRFVTP